MQEETHEMEKGLFSLFWATSQRCQSQRFVSSNPTTSLYIFFHFFHSRSLITLFLAIKRCHNLFWKYLQVFHPYFCPGYTIEAQNSKTRVWHYFLSFERLLKPRVCEFESHNLPMYFFSSCQDAERHLDPMACWFESHKVHSISHFLTPNPNPKSNPALLPTGCNCTHHTF